MRQVINNTPSGSGLGDTLYVATNKINAMTEEIYDILGTLSGSLAKTKTSEFINDGEDGTHPFLTTEDSITIEQVVGLQAALDNLQLNINGLASTITTNTSNITQLQSDTSTISTTVTDILSSITAQQAQISDIQQDIANIYNIINA